MEIFESAFKDEFFEKVRFSDILFIFFCKSLCKFIFLENLLKREKLFRAVTTSKKFEILHNDRLTFKGIHYLFISDLVFGI
jgi:hypothetical protein